MSIDPKQGTYTRPPVPDPSSEGERLRSKFRRLIVVWTCVFVAVPIAAIYFNAKGNSVSRAPVRLSTGEVVAGKIVSNSLSKDAASFQCRKILEALYCWTERGGVAAVEPFVHDLILKDMANRHAPVVRRKQPYQERLIIAPKNFVLTAATPGMRLVFKFRGHLISKGVSGDATNEVFYQVRFRPAPADKVDAGNDMGWYLTDLRKMEREEYEKDEIATEIKAVTKVKP